MADARPERAAYAYAVIRLVPRVERGECLNVGVVLFCRARHFLGARTVRDEARLRAFAPGLDLEGVKRHLEEIERVAAGDPAGSSLARLPATERFGWLVAPASTVIQPGPVHGGASADPAATLADLFAKLVAPYRP
ncbi:MAG: DUF3037 domain-containing protein [Chloroflexia bacterium]|nr:DUF3037 domain-containing protein [Chloroflexia bacterium]